MRKFHILTESAILIGLLLTLNVQVEAQNDRSPKQKAIFERVLQEACPKYIAAWSSDTVIQVLRATPPVAPTRCGEKGVDLVIHVLTRAEHEQWRDPIAVSHLIQTATWIADNRLFSLARATVLDIKKDSLWRAKLLVYMARQVYPHLMLDDVTSTSCLASTIRHTEAGTIQGRMPLPSDIKEQYEKVVRHLLKEEKTGIVRSTARCLAIGYINVPPEDLEVEKE